MCVHKMLRLVLLLTCLVAVHNSLPARNLMPFKRLRSNEARIVEGNVASKGQFPWQLSMQDVEFDGHPYHFCAASIYDNITALTTAICCDFYTRVRVVAGELELYAETENGQAVNVYSQHKHELFNPMTFENDICVLTLNDTFIFDSYVSPVTIPNETDSFSGYAQVAGWGANATGGFGVDRLMFANLSILSTDECRNTGYNAADIYDTMLCATSSEGQGTCHFDQGGALVQDSIQVGLSSWSYGCAFPGYPGVYTELAPYLDWIANVTAVDNSTTTTILPEMMSGLDEDAELPEAIQESTVTSVPSTAATVVRPENIIIYLLIALVDLSRKFWH